MKNLLNTNKPEFRKGKDSEKINYTDYFCSEKNYYYNAWVNGNKNHVLTHLRIYSCQSDAILYNAILNQFSHDEKLLKHLLNKVDEYAGTFINKEYL